VSVPPNEVGYIPRSLFHESVISINTRHPDFTARLKKTVMGRPKFTERLAAYLAILVSAHYNEMKYLSSSGNSESNIKEIYDDLIGITNRIETAMKRKMSEIQNSLDSVVPQDVLDLIEDELEQNLPEE